MHEPCPYHVHKPCRLCQYRDVRDDRCTYAEVEARRLQIRMLTELDPYKSDRPHRDPMLNY